MRLTDRALEANLENGKTVFRRKSREKLNSVLKKGVYYADKAFEKNLLSFIKRKNPKKILIFLPLSLEPNVKSVIKKLRVQKRSVYIPFIEDISFKIVKYRLPLKKGAFNILSCNNSYEFIRKIDMTIVPVIGIDSKFRRIGFGRGMYDRFFSSLQYKPIIVFVQRALCFSRDEIGEAHDTVGDYLILPNKIFVKGRIKNAYNSINGYGSRCVVRANRVFRSKKNRFYKIPNLHRAVKV